MIAVRKTPATRLRLLYSSRGVRGLGRLGGLGEYCNQYGCFNYDQARGAYVTADGKTEDELRPAPTTSASSVPLPSLDYGSFGNSGGGYTYYSSQNPLLQQNVTGNTVTGGVQALNNSNFATREAAEQFARALGGTVVKDPYSVSDWNQTAWAIKLPDGTTVNAGAIASTIANAAFGNTNVQSGEIAKLFGADPSQSRGLVEALMSGQRYELTAGAPAPGYLPTPLSASYKPPSSSTSTARSGGSSTSSGGSTSGGSTSGGGNQSAGNGDNGGAAAGGGLMDWFTGSMFGGVPNWVLLAGGVGALFMFNQSGGGRR